MKHQLDATLCRFYFCRVTLHVSGACTHHQEYLKLVQRPLVHVLSLQVSHHISLLGPEALIRRCDAEIKPEQCCIKLVFHLIFSPLHVSILGQPNTVHIPTSHLLKIRLNIIHPSTPRFPQWSLSLPFPHQDPIHPTLLITFRMLHVYSLFAELNESVGEKISNQI